MGEKFTRETRYMIIKLADIERYLGASQIQQLCAAESTINFGRQQDDRGILTAVVVESDWPEYGPTWKAIEDRMSSQAPECFLCEYCDQPIEGDASHNYDGKGSCVPF